MLLCVVCPFLVIGWLFQLSVLVALEIACQSPLTPLGKQKGGTGERRSLGARQ
ncbi:MAG: hypothetical protein F6K17_03765 [Okeania sp. SIO3C4]|nr:hypothetical protein [Okeania sp. SIO3B3]NER01811.1 hypothetical protein [Okeania sp. SIO3C4]